MVFHHRTTKEDNGLYLGLDNIEVGYDNKDTAAAVKTSPKLTDEKDIKAALAQGVELIKASDFETSETPTSPQRFEKKQFGFVNQAYLTGYEVIKDGVVVENIDDFNKTTYGETIDTNGTYTYDVVALYSDGVKSQKETVVVEITTLGTNEATANAGLKVYPNLSTGQFVVEADASVSTLKASVYDMSGKPILNNTFKGHRFELNLTQYPKGIYILNLVDNQGVKHNVKLMVK